MMTRYGFDLNVAVTFVTEVRNLPIKQFKPRDSLSVGKRLGDMARGDRKGTPIL